MSRQKKKSLQCKRKTKYKYVCHDFLQRSTHLNPAKFFSSWTSTFENSHSIRSLYYVLSCLVYRTTEVKKKKNLFFKFFALYFCSNKTNYVPPRKRLKRRFICEQSQVSSSIRLEVIKNQRGRGQNPVLQKSLFLRDFFLHKLSSFLHNF